MNKVILSTTSFEKSKAELGRAEKGQRTLY